MLYLWKKTHFVQNYRLINVINRREFNILQIISVKKKFQKNFKNKLKFLKTNIDNKYQRIKKHWYNITKNE